MSWLDPWLPEPWMVWTLGPLFLLFGVAAGRWAGRIRVQRGLRVAYTRKIFHFAVFTAAGAVHLLWGQGAVVLFGAVTFAVVAAAVWRGEGEPIYEGLARPEDAPRERLFILVPAVTTALGGVAVYVLFPEFAHVGYLVAGWGDAVGEPVGARWGRRPYRVPSLAGVPAVRTLEGSMAVAGVGMGAASLGLLLGGIPLSLAWWVGPVCGLSGALVEAVSHHGTDNFTVQLAGAAPAAFLV